MRASRGESGSCDAAVPAASVTSKAARKTVFMATLLSQISRISVCCGQPSVRTPLLRKRDFGTPRWQLYRKATSVLRLGGRGHADVFVAVHAPPRLGFKA